MTMYGQMNNIKRYVEGVDKKRARLKELEKDKDYKQFVEFLELYQFSRDQRAQSQYEPAKRDLPRVEKNYKKLSELMFKIDPKSKEEINKVKK